MLAWSLTTLHHWAGREHRSRWGEAEGGRKRSSVWISVGPCAVEVEEAAGIHVRRHKGQGWAAERG